MTLYDLCNFSATATVYLYNLRHLKEQKAILGGWSRSFMERCGATQRRGMRKLMASAWFWAVIESIFISSAQYLPGGFLNTAFGRLAGTGANYFGLILFAPVFLVAGCLLLRTDPLRQIDLITPAFPLALSVSKLGCFFADCCTGIEMDLGFYTRITGRAEFPIQLVEAGVAVVLFVLLRRWRGKLQTGTMFPVYLIVYSGIRFFTEFLRREPAVLWILKTYHILCIAGVLVGVLEYMLVMKYSAWKKRKSEATQ